MKPDPGRFTAILGADVESYSLLSRAAAIAGKLAQSFRQ
jgi:hypothetical protein